MTDNDKPDDIESILEAENSAEKAMAEKGLERREGFAFAFPEKDAQGNMRSVRLLQALPRRDAAGVSRVGLRVVPSQTSSASLQILRSVSRKVYRP